ncbi:MAG: hypothetical protein KGJ28_16055, partial [Alphaproteobacteria bacterium]|nr:hypothetical protein [Alphaproteobacteria bacterium]
MLQFYKYKFPSPTKPGTWIYVQTEDERLYAQTLVKTIHQRWHPPKYFFHLQKGGHLKALHRQKPDAYFARLDIEKFYGTVTRNKLTRALKKIGFSFADAVSLSHRSCVVLDGGRRLPYGYVQSPILASLVLDTSALGHGFREVLEKDVNLSVFMDDVLLSHPDSSALIDEALMVLHQAAEKSGFTFSAEKFEGPADLVTIFNIILQHESLTLTPERYESFAQRVLAQGHGNSTQGILGYVRHVNEQQSAELEDLL